MGSSPDQVKLKTIKLVFVASPLSVRSIKEKEQRLVARNQDNMFEWDDMSGLVQRGLHHHLAENLLVLAMMALSNNYSLTLALLRGRRDLWYLDL